MSDQSANNKRIAKNTAFLYIRMLFVLLVTLYTTRVVLNALGVEDYGTYNVVCGFVSLFGFLNTSLSQGIQRFFNYELGQGGNEAVLKVFNTALIIQLGLIVLLFIVLEGVGYYWFTTELVVPEGRREVAWIIFQFSIVSMLVNILSTPYAAMVMSYERMNYYAVVSVLDAVIKLLVALSLPYVPFDKLLYYGVLLLIISVLNFFMYSIYCHRKFSFLKVNFSFDGTLFRSMFTFSGWNFLGSLASMIKTQGTNILLNSFFGVVVNASSGIAAQVSSAVQQFSLNIVIAFRPQLVTAYSQNNVVRVQKMMFVMSKIGFLLVFTLAVPILLEIDYILALWLGDSVPAYAAAFSQLTIVAMVVGIFNAPVTQVIHATGRMKRYQIVTSLTMCSILPISWIFFRMGYNASLVYWITVFITILNQCFSLVVLHAEFKYSYKQYLKEIVLPCVVVAILAPIFPWILCRSLDVSFIRLVLVILSACVVMFVLGYGILLNKAERLLLRNTVQNKIVKRINK